MDEVLKLCSKCRTPLPLHMFAKDKSKVSGLRPSCKSCDKKYRLSKKIDEKRHLSIWERCKNWWLK